MKNSRRNFFLAIGLVLAVLGLMASCSRPTVSGYSYSITSRTGQNAAWFECRYATQTNACTIAVQAGLTASIATYSIGVGQSQTLNDAPVGSQYCVSDGAAQWDNCLKSYVQDGTTTVTVGTTIH